MHTSESPRSSFSGLSGSPPKLDPNTIALLDSFLSTKAEEERRFNELAEQAAARVAGLALDAHTDEEEAVEDEVGEKPMISVDEYRLVFGEDWQLSQFWYSTSFATRLARYVRSLCAATSTIAFMCCPTAFVAFQHTNPLDGARLLEYDQRFTVLAPKKFIPYDLDEPDDFPEALRGSVDIAVIDPPFLNETTNKKIIQTVRQILHPTRGKLLLLSSTSIEKILHRLYDKEPIGPLRRTSLTVEHGELANDYACWGSWEGAKDIGKGDEAESEVST